MAVNILEACGEVEFQTGKLGNRTPDVSHGKYLNYTELLINFFI